MSLDNWKITKVSPAGDQWAITITGLSGSAYDHTLELTNYFNKGSGYININDVTSEYLGERASINDPYKVYISVSKEKQEYLYFPKFLSWNWDLKGTDWHVTGIDDSFIQTWSGEKFVDPFERMTSPYRWHITNSPSLEPGTSADYFLQIGESNGLSYDKNHAFANTFFQSGSTMYIDGSNLTITSGYFNGPSGANILATNYSDRTPLNEDEVSFATYNSRIKLTGKSAEEIQMTRNVLGNNFLQIFYDFKDYDDFHIKSEVPAVGSMYSGSVYGDMNEFNNISTTGKGVFNRNNYIKLDNTTGLFSKSSTFLFSYKKEDQDPSCVFSNFGGYTYPTSGFSFGFNSANRLYYDGYNDSMPYVCTLENNNAAKGIYFVRIQGQQLSLGSYNIHQQYFNEKSFPINPNFNRESYDWYLGTGLDYSCDGFLDKFMYFNAAVTTPVLNLIAQSFTQNVTGIPERIRVATPFVTGYQMHSSGVTGVIGYTGVLSGVVEDSFSGYNVTGSGMTGYQHVFAQYNLYLTGDAYTGLHLYSNLDKYELYRSGDSFWQITGTSAQKEISSLAYNPNRETLLLNNSDNANTYFSEMNQAGELVRIIRTDFQEVEGMCHISGYKFAVADEGEGKLYYGDIKTATTGIKRADWTAITIPSASTWGNTGIEGVTFDTGNNCFYVCQEGQETNPANRPPRVFKVDFDGTTKHMFDAQHLADDLSDIFYDHGTSTFYLLSDHSQKIVQATTGGKFLYEKDLSIIPWVNHQAEGLTFSTDMNKMFIASERDNGAVYNYNSALKGTYELLRSYTGFFSGDYAYNMDFYKRSPLTGLDLIAVTGFTTGLQAYEYTIPRNVYVPSGITGYLYTGYSYTPLSGSAESFTLSFITGNLITTNEIYDYFFNKLAYIDYRGDLDKPTENDYFEFITRKFDVKNDGTYEVANAYNKNRQADFAYSNIFEKNVFYPSLGGPTGTNLFFNGLAQHEGTIAYKQNTLYESIPYVLSGDYAFSGLEIIGDNFETASRFEDEVLYDYSQPSYNRHEVTITGYDQWVAPKSYDLGINPHNSQVFINGQKIYSGIDYYAEPSQPLGSDFHGSGSVTGISGNLMTFPQYTGSYNISGGSGLFDIQGTFLPGNIYYVNGVRQTPNKFIVYCSGVGLITGTGVGIGRDAEIFYHKEASYFFEGDDRQFIYL